MSTRTERLTAASDNIDITLRTFLDIVMQSSATDIEKAKILQAQRLYSAAHLCPRPPWLERRCPVNHQKKLTKVQIEQLDRERERLENSRSMIVTIYLRLDSNSKHDKSLYAVTEMLNIIDTLLASVIEPHTREN